MEWPYTGMVKAGTRADWGKISISVKNMVPIRHSNESINRRLVCHSGRIADINLRAVSIQYLKP